MSTPPPEFLEINGIRTAHLTEGSGPPILMLHGWGAHGGLIWALAHPLSKLGYRVYVPDLPGFGQTASPPTAWSVHDYTIFVLAYMDYLQLERVFLFGHSFGGRLSLVLGADYASRIIKIALADSAGVRPPVPTQVKARQTLAKFARQTLRQFGMSHAADELRDWYGNRYGSTDYQNAGALRDTMIKVVSEDLLSYAARVAVPTLLFWGDQDQDTPLWQGQLLEKTIPDAGLIIHQGAGHYSYLDALSDTVKIMDHFFKQH